MTDVMHKLKVLISGGGLAGLTTAYWLNHYGHEAVVVEQAPSLRRDGYGIDFFGTGYDVAERMGIIDTLAERQIFLDKEGGIAFVDDMGRAKAELRIDKMREVLGGKYMGLMHYTLEEVLYEAVSTAVDIRFNTSIASVAQTEKSVSVTFENEQSETFDLLVGADGIHSNVRQLVFGPEEQFGHYMGYYVGCYFVPDKYQRNAVWENYTEPGKQTGVYACDREGQLVTLFLWQAEDEGYIPHDQRQAKLQAAFADMGWITPQLLADMPENSQDIFVDTVTQIHMDSWRNGRVVLVGDAAGCMTLISGQGASMALGSAYVLAEELSQADDWQQALANYEHRVKPQIELRQNKARDFAKQFVPGSELGIKAQAVIMKLVTYQAFSGLLKTQFVGDSFLKIAALQRLPQSKGNVIGYRIAGKLQTTDYQTLTLGLDEVLQNSVTVSLLLQIEELEGIKPNALLDDLKFGRDYRHKIDKIAIVADGRFSKWLAKMSEPFFAKDAKHFATAELDAAWGWLID